ncbi:MAG: hypothetical protein ABIW76_23870, partial [Fibrobacteria bacterium]
MNSRYTRKLCLIALAGSLWAGHSLAQEMEVNCGTVDVPAALAKTADLPKITKTYSGKLKALVIRIGFSDAPYA